MSIFDDKRFIKIIDLAQLSMELLNRQSNVGNYHKVHVMLDDIRYYINKTNQKLDDDKCQYYNRTIERGLESAISSLEGKGFQQPEIYDLYELLSHVRSFIN